MLLKEQLSSEKAETRIYLEDFRRVNHSRNVAVDDTV
jgi:hypothetical protein